MAVSSDRKNYIFILEIQNANENESRPNKSAKATKHWKFCRKPNFWNSLHWKCTARHPLHSSSRKKVVAKCHGFWGRKCHRIYGCNMSGIFGMQNVRDFGNAKFYGFCDALIFKCGLKLNIWSFLMRVKVGLSICSAWKIWHFASLSMAPAVGALTPDAGKGKICSLCFSSSSSSHFHQTILTITVRHGRVFISVINRTVNVWKKIETWVRESLI